ncbi:TonB-dependent receptor [Aliikangiella marina]|uniref:TonB-dependent receptor n=1 Tax=Aliikangiella marina TaxID=1712262 RepID=A0A545T1D1_9GAMM|nr:TonB-dependent receptor [Aliikangiella marina]TQV71021.1 TonB-dependent receptor [Aliikangiella marina]
MTTPKCKFASCISLALLKGSILATPTSVQANNNTLTSPDGSTKLVITGSPIQRSIEGSSEQLDEYDNQAIIDAGDLLTRIAGISAIRAGGHATDPVLRGQAQTRINLLQQGAFLHGAGPNRMDSPGAYTEPFGWDEVQIIKGIETLTLGSGGPAGSINFKRHAPEFDNGNFSGKLMAAYAEDYYKIASDLSIGDDRGYFRLVSQIMDQESYEDGDGNLTRTAFETVSNTLIGGYQFSDNQELRLSLMANRGSDALFAGTMMDGPTTDMDAAQLIFIDGDELADNYSEYQIYWNDAHHVMDNFSLRQQTAPMRMLTDSNSKTTGAKWLKRWSTEQSVWQTVIDWQNIERDANRFMGMMGIPNILQARIWPDNTLEIFGIAVENEYRFSDSARIKAGVRFDQVTAEANGLLDPTIGTLYENYYGQVQPRSNEDNWSGFTRFYSISDQSLYWLGLSSTVRTADATERYLGAGNINPMMRWIGNPNIDPERHNQIELGGKWNFASGWHELSIYYNQVDDFILRDRARMQTDILLMDGATIYRNADVTLSGFEWTLRSDITDSWSFNANLAYVKGDNDDTNVPLYQIPPVEGLIQLVNHHADLAYFIDIRFADSQDKVDDNMMTGSALDAGPSDSWQAIDLKARYNLNQSWQISVGINNLFDETYAYHVSRANLDPFNPQAVRVNEPGRQVWLSMLANF